jgi:hypothetical protein
VHQAQLPPSYAERLDKVTIAAKYSRENSTRILQSAAVFQHFDLGYLSIVRKQIFSQVNIERFTV